jgi:hypothetical protein
MRFAVVKATAREVEEVKRCKAMVEAISGELIQFDFRNGPMRRKFDSVKYNLRKLEVRWGRGWMLELACAKLVRVWRYWFANAEHAVRVVVGHQLRPDSAGAFGSRSAGGIDPRGRGISDTLAPRF